MSEFIDRVLGPTSSLTPDQKKVVAGEVQMLAGLKGMPQDAVVQNREKQVLNDLMQAARQATAQDDTTMSDSDQASALALNLFSEMNSGTDSTANDSLFSSNNGSSLGLPNFGGSNYGGYNYGGNNFGLGNSSYSGPNTYNSPSRYGYGVGNNNYNVSGIIRQAVGNAVAQAMSGSPTSPSYSSSYTGSYNPLWNRSSSSTGNAFQRYGTSGTQQVGGETGDKLNKVLDAISSGNTAELQRQATSIANDGGNSPAIRAAAERLHTDAAAGKPAAKLNQDLRDLEDLSGLRANSMNQSGKPHGVDTSSQVEAAGRSILDNNWQDVANQMSKIMNDPKNSDELKQAAKTLKDHLDQHKDAGTLIADLNNVKKAAGFTK